jgi:hypothetical protein
MPLPQVFCSVWEVVVDEAAQAVAGMTLRR